MNKFQRELKNNNFVCSFCTQCNKFVWPPSDICNLCFGNVVWRPVKKIAKLIEFSYEKDEIFCIAEFEGNIRIMGNLKNANDLKIDQSLILIRCDYDGKEKFILDASI